MNTVKIDSASFDNLKHRVLKFLRLGKDDVQTAKEVSPYGVDSSPIKGMVALYGQSSSGNSYIVGYLNVNQVAEPGELRLFCTNSSGAVQNYVWMKANGNVELGGSADNLVRYNPLDQSMQELASFVNGQLQAISAGIVAAGGAYTPGTLSIDITEAKAPKLKTE